MYTLHQWQGLVLAASTLSLIPATLYLLLDRALAERSEDSWRWVRLLFTRLW